jgi:hypothetical protein
MLNIDFLVSIKKIIIIFRKNMMKTHTNQDFCVDWELLNLSKQEDNKESINDFLVRIRKPQQKQPIINQYQFSEYSESIYFG